MKFPRHNCLRALLPAILLPALLSMCPLAGAPESVSMPDISPDTIKVEEAVTPKQPDTTSLYVKLKKSEFVRDFPTIYADTVSFENGTFVFRALLMKKFWYRLKWLYSSKHREPAPLPDSAVSEVADTTVRPMVRFGQLR